MGIKWGDVGNWIKDNAGPGAALVGSLLTGNAAGAIVAGRALVSSATGTNDPEQALLSMQNDPQTVVELRRLALENEADIRKHIEAMERLKLENEQAAHEETQKTIRAGDIVKDKFIRWTRPGQSWLWTFAAIAYVFTADTIDPYILGTMLVQPWSYAGMRQYGKRVDVLAAVGKLKK